MAHSPEIRDRVRRLYVFERLGLEMAALQCGVSMSTAGRWKRESLDAGDDWDKLRAANILAGGGIENVARAALTGFMTQYQATMDTLNSNAEIQAEAKVKMLASGSSPRLRGTPSRMRCSWSHCSVHPRVRGEHNLAELEWLGKFGSSPRPRGTQTS